MLKNVFEINVEQLKETDNCLARVCDGTLHLEDRLEALKEIYMSLNTQTKVIIASAVAFGSAILWKNKKAYSYYQ